MLFAAAWMEWSAGFGSRPAPSNRHTILFSMAYTEGEFPAHFRPSNLTGKLLKLFGTSSPRRRFVSSGGLWGN
jgi:hypothetical protein